MVGGLKRRLAGEDGAIAIIFALSLVVLLGATAFVVDLGRTRHAKQQLQDAVDSASIAAAAFLPANNKASADTVTAWAVKLTVASSSGIVPADVGTSFLCVLRYPDNTPGGVMPDLGTDAASACGPATPNAWSSAGGWTTKTGGVKTTHLCNPYIGDLCNAVKVQSAQTIKYLFAPVLGVSSGSTGAVQSVACKGLCKPTGAPLDVQLVLDRTGSMTPTNITNLIDAAKTLLQTYDPTQQWISLMALPYGNPANPCNVNNPQAYPNTSPAAWLMTSDPASPKTFSHDYQVVPATTKPPTLNNSSQLVQRLNCIVRTSSNPTITVNGNNTTNAGHTNLGDPIAAAEQNLRANGRPNVPDVIIFMTDGEANQPKGLNPCNYAVTQSAAAKAANRQGGTAQVYTIGYGVGADKTLPASDPNSQPARCTQDTSGPYAVEPSDGKTGAFATRMLANMASPTAGGLPADDNSPGDCVPSENTDKDNYFCEDKSGDLAAVFKAVAIQSAKNARLLDVD